ncbi:MAG: glycosyltransferase [Candidatus Dormibacteraeota bacterium]|nr:glycosyltransferase [Candidatus Dormibacteraeota bacterium]
MTTVAPATRLLLVAQPLSAGVPRHVLDIVDELGQEGFELTVACPRGSSLWAELSGRQGVRLAEFTAARGPRLSDLWWVLRMIPLLRRSDVVHAHSSKAALLVRASALPAGRRRSCVVTPHAWSFWAVSGWRRNAAVAVERMAARACGAIVAVSGHERDEGLRRGIGRPDQYRVIPNGVDLARWAIERRPDPDLVVMVARLEMQKRPELAVRALAVARRQRPAMRLVIAGGGSLAGSLMRLAEDLGVSAAVCLLGHSDQVPQLLSGAGCVVVTSAYEACSLVILEAMAAGVPVVAVRTGGIDELVQDGVTGMLCGERPEEIADALLAVSGDARLAQRYGEQARQYATRQFSRRQMALRLAVLYESLSSEQRASEARDGPRRRVGRPGG